MKSFSFLALVLLSASPLMSAIFGDMKFGDSNQAIARALKDCVEIEAAEKPILKKDRFLSVGTLSDPIAHQQWSVNFFFNQSGKKLESVLMIADEGMDVEQFDKTLKSFYLYTLTGIKRRYDLRKNALNTPFFKQSDEFKKGEFLPLHSYAKDDMAVTLGLILDVKQKKIFIACELTPREESSALGGGKVRNTGEEEEVWQDIPLWDNIPEAMGFLVRKGLREAPPEPLKPEEGSEGTQGAEPTEGATTPEEDAEDDPLSVVDTSLSEVEQNLLRGHILLDMEKNEEAATAIISAAKASDARAFYALARCYEDGLGVIKDEQKALKAYERSAQLGYALAMVRFGAEYTSALAALGLTMEEGKDLRDASHEAASAGSVSARFNMAIMLRYGFGLRKDMTAARALLEQLSLQGDVEAQDILRNDF